MSLFVVGTALVVGILLGRFFKIFVLVPASALAIVLVVASPTSENSLWYSILEIGVIVTSLQVGYVFGVSSHQNFTLPPLSKVKRWFRIEFPWEKSR